MYDSNSMYKDIYDEWYANKDKWHSYSDVLNYLAAKYEIINEGTEIFEFNIDVNKIYAELTTKDYSETFKYYMQISM